MYNDFYVVIYYLTSKKYPDICFGWPESMRKSSIFDKIMMCEMK